MTKESGKILTAFGCIIILFLNVWIMMLLWNYLMPMLFALPTLSYWQTFGLRILCCSLFKAEANYEKYIEKNKNKCQ